MFCLAIFVGVNITAFIISSSSSSLLFYCINYSNILINKYVLPQPGIPCIIQPYYISSVSSITLYYNSYKI